MPSPAHRTPRPSLRALSAALLILTALAAASPDIPPRARAAAPAPIALGASMTAPSRGLYAPCDTAPMDDFAAQTGRRPAIALWYQPWGGYGPNPQWADFPARCMDNAYARGAVVLTTWEPWDGNPSNPAYKLTTITRGDFDPYIRRYADGAKVWGHPFYLRFAHEMNGNWYPWGTGPHNPEGNTPADYVAAWRHVHDLFVQEGAANVRWVWSPNTLSSNSPQATATYPGDAYVDWLAMDGYNVGSSNGYDGWTSAAALFSPLYTALATLPTKPMMIAETASSEMGGDKAAWITQAYADIPNRFPRVRAVVWFDEDKETDWRVDSSPAALAAYRAVVTDPAFQAPADTSAGGNSAIPTATPILSVQTATPAATATATSTPTRVPPTPTAITTLPPTATGTNTAPPASAPTSAPTSTRTSIPASPTVSPAPPTATAPFVPSTVTYTDTPKPTAMGANTSVPTHATSTQAPTMAATDTPVPPSAPADTPTHVATTTGTPTSAALPSNTAMPIAPTTGLPLATTTSAPAATTTSVAPSITATSAPALPETAPHPVDTVFARIPTATPTTILAPTVIVKAPPTVSATRIGAPAVIVTVTPVSRRYATSTPPPTVTHSSATSGRSRHGRGIYKAPLGRRASHSTSRPTTKERVVVDDLSSWNTTFSHTPNLRLVSISRRPAGSDTSHAVRSKATHAEIVWKQPGMTLFQVHAYYWVGATATPLGVYTSPNGRAWRTARSTVAAVKNIAGFREYVYTVTTGPPLAYVKIRWNDTSGRCWSQQVGRVTMTVAPAIASWDGLPAKVSSRRA